MQDFTVFLSVQSTSSPFLAIGLAQNGAGEPWLLWERDGVGKLAPAPCSQRGCEGNSSQTYLTSGDGVSVKA